MRNGMGLYLGLHPSTVGQFTPQTAASSPEIHQKSCQGPQGRRGPLSSMFCEEASSVPQCFVGNSPEEFTGI